MVRQFSAQTRHRETTLRSLGRMACCALSLLLSTNVGRPQSTVIYQQNVVRPPARELSDVELARSFRRFHHHVNHARPHQLPRVYDAAQTPQLAHAVAPTSNRWGPHRLPSIKDGEVHQVAEVQGLMRIVEETQTSSEPPSPAASAAVRTPNVAPPVPLPLEPRPAAAPVTSAVGYSGFDLHLFPELARTRHANSSTDAGAHARDLVSARRDAAKASWRQQQVFWDPTNLSYAPVYFEDTRLERHGHHLGTLQPIASGLHFFATVPALPYLVTQQHPISAVYPLGQTRPGDHIAPYHERLRFDWKAALAEAGTWIGFFALFP